MLLVVQSEVVFFKMRLPCILQWDGLQAALSSLAPPALTSLEGVVAFEENRRLQYTISVLIWCLSSAESVREAGADAYTNRYRNGWSASAAAARQALDDARRPGRRRVANAVPFTDMPQPVPMSRFQWPQSQVPLTKPLMLNPDC